MSISDLPLASLKAKESSATTLLLGAAWVGWMLAASSSMPLSNNDARPKDVRVLRDGSTCGSSSQVSEIIDVPTQPAYRPKTALGRKLMELRKAAIMRGMHLLTADEINDEIEQRRGEVV